MPKIPTRFTAILIAVLVTFLWSTSWVLIKIGLKSDLPALSFAGLRYFTAVLCLAPFVLFNPRERAILKSLSRRDWLQLSWLGLLMIAVAQGAQFVSLSYLPTVVVSLLLNLSPIAVGWLSLSQAHEHPTTLQWVGILFSALGTLIYFLPFSMPQAALIGFLAALVGLLSNAYATLLSRGINKQQHFSPLVVTFVSMGIGSPLMLLGGWLTGGLGHPSATDWAIIGWLAVVNTALAFTLWNYIQRTLNAVEISILNSLMLPQIAILAWVFLGESISVKGLIGLALVVLGTVLVQARQRTR
jgi:drug/metabolite transporter (DMT)-like permease